MAVFLLVKIGFGPLEGAEANATAIRRCRQ